MSHQTWLYMGHTCEHILNTVTQGLHFARSVMIHFVTLMEFRERQRHQSVIHHLVWQGMAHTQMSSYEAQR